VNFRTPWTYAEEQVEDSSGTGYPAWIIRDKGGDPVCECWDEDDAKFIVRSVNLFGQSE
jgi:hypothetical protein